MQARKLVVVLLVLGAVFGLYCWPRGGDDPRHDFGSHVAQCATNLARIYQGLIVYRARSGHAPQGSGVLFLAELIASGALEDTPENRALLTCPGRHARPVPAGTDYKDLASLTPLSSAYAARNTAEFPLVKFPSGGGELEALVACDNADGLNHEGVMNVLYSDGSIATLVLEQEIERGLLPAGSQTIAVGRDSPLPELRKLVPDRVPWERRAPARLR